MGADIAWGGILMKMIVEELPDTKEIHYKELCPKCRSKHFRYIQTCTECRTRMAVKGRKRCVKCLMKQRSPSPEFYWDKKGIYK